jgi:hypothetical protein
VEIYLVALDLILKEIRIKLTFGFQMAHQSSKSKVFPAVSLTRNSVRIPSELRCIQSTMF